MKQVRGCRRPLFTFDKVARSPSLQPLTEIEQKQKKKLIAQLFSKRKEAGLIREQCVKKNK